MPDPLLLVILGPTASGKTALSLALADRFGGEIVNCDSVAVYRDFEIGTAKPTAAERARAPHHLFDIVAPTDLMTAGEYARRARAVLADIKTRGRVPIVVGGTGLYLRALLEGLSAGPQRSEAIRGRLRAMARRHEAGNVGDVILSESAASGRAEGPLKGHPERARPPLPRESKDPGAPIRAAERSEALHARKARILTGSAYLHRLLRRLDPAAAARIHPNDEPKIIRAVEVCLAARQPITKVWEGGREPLRGFRIVRLGLDPDRAALYTRINQRAARMFDLGLLEETAALLAKYADAANQESEIENRKSNPDDLPRVFDSLGYHQAVQLLHGELDRPAAIAAAQQAHRNYAKRQLTWFRREPDVQWLRGFGDDPGIQQQAISLLAQLAASN